MKISTIFLISLSILIPSGLFTFFIKGTRSIQETNFTLQINQPLELQNKSKVLLSDESIKKLNDVINQTNSIPNEERLLIIFEREREHYILLISLITIILTIMSIYFIFTRFVEKEEYEELKIITKNMRVNYENILNDIKFNLIVQEVIIKTDLYNKTLTLIDDETMKVVNNREDFEKYIFDQYNELFKEIAIYTSNTNFKKIYAPTFNYMNAIMRYGFAKKFLSKEERNIDKSIFFKTQIHHIKIIFGNKKYLEFRNYIKSGLPNFNFPN
ncbi:hypothetical protein EHQ16_19370 [Leptospira kanakyensis]|uniref:Uncharacterized protein n=1 Tax=Leptospira kanakyensis TaxID=2484968 RepID=A0A6N4PQH4_9LEPT|nr:hypothetical protein [Leptospira kanakyensis]TGK51144.1 hypothetical protein EHQ11_09100 [Leptospira kanakyensis]TGK56370.1 hypothetical protein EHQ16_19370 [Leptospira kanakyensis]TGK65688.1 hypothetical protein EHQ18_19155 [Leptospira kanakyensis]